MENPVSQDFHENGNIIPELAISSVSWYLGVPQAITSFGTMVTLVVRIHSAFVGGVGAHYWEEENGWENSVWLWVIGAIECVPTSKTLFGSTQILQLVHLFSSKDSRGDICCYLNVLFEDCTIPLIVIIAVVYDFIVSDLKRSCSLIGWHPGKMFCWPTSWQTPNSECPREVKKQEPCPQPLLLPSLWVAGEQAVTNQVSVQWKACAGM